jgi:hypothetical protein
VTAASGEGPESDPLPGPVLQTAAQNDQLCAAELEITNQATAAPNGGYACGLSVTPIRVAGLIGLAACPEHCGR